MRQLHTCCGWRIVVSVADEQTAYVLWMNQLQVLCGWSKFRSLMGRKTWDVFIVDEDTADVMCAERVKIYCGWNCTGDHCIMWILVFSNHIIRDRSHIMRCGSRQIASIILSMQMITSKNTKHHTSRKVDHFIIFQVLLMRVPTFWELTFSTPSVTKPNSCCSISSLENQPTSIASSPALGWASANVKQTHVTAYAKYALINLWALTFCCSGLLLESHTTSWAILQALRMILETAGRKSRHDIHQAQSFVSRRAGQMSARTCKISSQDRTYKNLPSVACLQLCSTFLIASPNLHGTLKSGEKTSQIKGLI